ncbi:FKBP-type peptidyl-prolyl cis-trans isomerase [Pedobacter frigoris]|uniref:FKBP-type peptidyl-prolyl cis-trans isomerase n=1 Tax=Pedobacter frigoris TaxID=2571272 RepID=UPI00292D4D2D|nr:FKBP-type peptidyl-prolyl cis-trans isomerase [Pedobacter frigoris]
MLKKISSYTFVLLGMIVVLSSCKKEYESIESIDQAKIQEYISKNNIAAVEDPAKSGFYYQIVTPGTGDQFANTDSILYTVTVKSLLNGTVYYESPVYSNIGTYVGYTNALLGLNATGIRTAIQALKPGGKARVILPSYLAFGKNGNTTIGVPSNEIIDVVISTYPEKKQRLLDDRLIREYLIAKGLTATKDPVTGVYYIVVTQGTGTEIIDMTTKINANYTGRYMLNGSVFDSSTDGSYSFVLTQLISGWDVLTKFKKGAKVRLFIPSSEGYGTAGSVNPNTGQIMISPNAILDFDIEILGVTN